MLAEFEAEYELVPDLSDDGHQTDEARDEADDRVLEEIEDADAGTVVVSKEDLLAGKQALEKVRHWIPCSLQLAVTDPLTFH